MKVSYNWIREYVNTDLSPEVIGEILTQTGLEVEGIQKTESIPGGLEGLVVGHVIEKDKHPDADRLSITKVDIGNGELLPIVCGAPNVAAGQKVVVATVGAKLYPSEGEAFKIKKGKIRGQESHGMICAEDEIGLGSGHDGIMVLDEQAKEGTAAKDYFNIEEDYCIEIGLTPNRTDGMGHIGVARDLTAALKNMVGIENDSAASVCWPSIDDFTVENTDLQIPIEVKDYKACPRYAGISIKNLKVGASPDWLQNRLRTIGLSPINNLVDITNFVLHETGQPLHAFDIDKIDGGKIIVTQLPADTPFTSLDEKERKLDKDDLMICNGLADSDPKNAAMCIGGVFGGIHSGVSESTTSIFLESAYFNPVSIRKSAKRHALNTDASFRFERGVDPNLIIYALKRAAMLYKEIAGGTICSDIQDLYPEPIPNHEFSVKWAHISRLIGKEISKDKIKNILTDLDIAVNDENETGFSVSVPPYRHDVTREADVIEEILRIYGYNNIEDPKNLNSSLSYSVKPDSEKLQNLVSDFLASQGFHEMMANSLSKKKYSELVKDAAINPEHNVEILNPLSSDLNVMRQNLLFNGLEAISLNQNHKNPDLKLFEFGKEYRLLPEKGYQEERHLAIYLTGTKNPENWNVQEDEFSFYDIKAVAESVLHRLGIYKNVKFEGVEAGIMADGLLLKINNKAVAKIGWVSDSLLKEFDIKKHVWFVDFNWDTVMDLMVMSKIKNKDLEKFPAVRRDLSLLINEDVQFSQIKQIVEKCERKLLRNVGLFDVYEGKKLPKGKKSYAISMIFQDPTKTMTDKQVDKIMGKVQFSLEKQVEAQLR